MMESPLLETKLHVPRRPPRLVARPRLSELLGHGAKAALTLVSAPAGFGKTTVLTEWLAAAPDNGPSVAWLSLDVRDNGPALFWAYLVAALRAAVPGVGGSAASLLDSAQPPIEAVLSTLLNDLQGMPNDVVLVLDDYHVIEAREIQEGMTFLLEHLPAQMHLVIAGRADPPIPLARLRGRGELVEIRAADLRFTPEEAAAYLKSVVGLVLTAKDAAALRGRTEGWIAALQLAALSMQGRNDVGAFIAGFAGDDRYIVDYLVEEVLQRQPEHVQRFLLQTSILERLSGPLCDAVTGQQGGAAKLAALERGNLFLNPLDDQRRWYRYHQLFADVLQARLLDGHSADVPGLHLRASSWYQENGEPFEAIRHALAAKDFELAADLIEPAVPSMRRNRREATLRDWMKLFPDELVRVRPVLGMGLVGALMGSGETDGVESRLRDIEECLGTPTNGPPGPRRPSAEMVVIDVEEFRRLPESIEVYRAGLSLLRGDAAGTVQHAQRALDLAPEEDHLNRAAAAGLWGLAAWGNGDLKEASRAYAQCMAGLRRAGHLSDTFGCALALADIRTVQGRLGDALRIYEEALQGASAHAGSPVRGTADMYVGMSDVLRERNDLHGAMEYLLRSQELGDGCGLPQNPYRWRVAMARLREIEGDWDGALDLLDEAERLYIGDYFPDVRPIPALKARLWARSGRVGEALGWAADRGLSLDDDLGYVHEFEHITLARLLLTQAATQPQALFLDEAVRLLNRLLKAADAGGRTGSVLEILVLQALAQQAGGNLAPALAILHRALALAEPEGYVRIFIDEGAPMAALLKAAALQGPAPRYVRRLVAAEHAAGHAADGGTNVPSGLIEPLSDRELDVLRLLRTDLNGPDIARELTVSLNTVRTHTSHIYAKFGVNNRRAAVRRANELGL